MTSGGAGAPAPDVKRGLRVPDRFGGFRVMSVAEGWAMCRRKGAMPFVVQVSAIQRQMERAS